jgi:hypothetical protein
MTAKTDYSSLKDCCDRHLYQFDTNKDMRRHFDVCHEGNPTPSYAKDYFRCDRVKDKKACDFKCDSRTTLDNHIASVHDRSGKSQRQSTPTDKNRKTTEKEHSKRKVDAPLRGDSALKKQKLATGVRVTVWYDDNKKYYSGAIKEVMGGDKYKMLWDDGRLKVDEIVKLKQRHNTLDVRDRDRWNCL